MVKEITCSAPVNIAVIKYWGKRDKKLILPTNSSLSVTLDQHDLRSTTTARLLDPSPKNGEVGEEEEDQLWLNGARQPIEKDSRLSNCLKELRKLKAHFELQQPKTEASLPESRRALLIASENNFPTAAGLASSASGFAALVYTISKLYELPIEMTELSKIARQGSGSACRSIFGGFVSWEMGAASDGSDSMAVSVAERSDWPDLEALICVVSDRKKGTSSTSGMDGSVQTSELLQHRIEKVVPERMKRMKSAIKEKDFDSFAALTMADSNQFHAVCLDTQPPIFYLNDVSRSIIAVIEELNRASKAEGDGCLAAYTFDAGPNAVIYAPKRNMRKLLNLILHYFPLPDSDPFTDPKAYFDLSKETPGQLALPIHFNHNISPVWKQGSISRLIHTQVGDGPQVLNNQLGQGLLTVDGLVKSLKNPTNGH
ncbi:diphosphomevalonate decarboxylase [Puccinia graminis f. sp. tritici]|uniref:Diphosphomevalonate decarboxylase n=1 Tax=Puccinia graminis f. sp. tritici TaxID=56615 RepID=A0A5B0QFC2_PUCGR|nr:diphosphomevalonate decarboxylase [Puccinia graminis f. sp. tritici]